MRERLDRRGEMENRRDEAKKKKNSRIVHGNNIYVYIKYNKFVWFVLFAINSKRKFTSEL